MNLKFIFLQLKKVITNKYFQLIFSIILLWLVFRSTNLPDLFSQLKQIPFTYNLLFFLLLIIIVQLTSLRWQLLLTLKADTKLLHAFFASSMMGIFYNLFLPSSNGGDLLKWTLLPKLEKTKKQILFSLLIDRMIGIIGLIAIGFTGYLFALFFSKIEFSFIVTAILSFAGLASLGLICLLLFPMTLFHLPILSSLSVGHSISIFLTRRRKEILGGILLTMLSQFIFFIGVWILAQGLHLPISLPQMLVQGSIAFVFASLPLSFAGFGTTELSFLYFFSSLPDTSILALTTVLAMYRIILASTGWFIGTHYQSQHIATSSENM
jgi:uncharacterized membrane protein YbhN (UPF0104 family)